MRFGQLDKVSFMLYDQADRLSVAWRGQGGAALLFTLLAMAAGWAVGWLAGLEPRHRLTLLY